jgi:hypothetical protein
MTNKKEHTHCTLKRSADALRNAERAMSRWRRVEPWRLLSGQFGIDVPGQRDGDKETRTVAWTGCGASGKTFAAGFYASLWWQADPANSIVCLTSTTKEMIGRRVWPVVQWFSTHAKDPTTGKVFNCGHMVDSRKMLQATKGDEKHAIFAMAVAQGETQKAVENLKGMHANRILLIIDEATGTPPAVVETVANMRKGCRDFTVLVIANAVSHLDCHGRVCRPEGGWESITVEDAEWKTSGVPEWELPPGICMHFDGSKSPNVVAKRTLYPFLYSWEDYRSALKHGVTKSVKFWSQTRGFWAPEGISDTILTEPLIEHHQGRSDTTFLSERKSVAFLDSAFGGDDCVAVFGAIGNTDGGDVLQIEESLLILPSAEVKDPVDHQVARQYKNACIARGVQPENAGADATGTGRGVYAILCEEWSHRVPAHRVRRCSQRLARQQRRSAPLEGGLRPPRHRALVQCARISDGKSVARALS